MRGFKISFEYNIVNVSHLVKKYESAGVAAICIEDKIFPKKNSLLEETEQELLPEKDFVAKIIAGKEAKMNNDFMVIARTEALIANQGIDEAIKRANAYEKAGADAILIHSKKISFQCGFNNFIYNPAGLCFKTN